MLVMVMSSAVNLHQGAGEPLVMRLVVKGALSEPRVR